MVRFAEASPGGRLCLLKVLFLTGVVLLGRSWAAETTADRWWPVQRAPSGVVKTVQWHGFESVTSPNGQSTAGPIGATHITVQSIAGLVARAVNQGRLDEMIWIDTPNPNYRLWYRRLVARLGLEERGTLGSWELVERYREKGIIQGYILYSYDYSQGGLFRERKEIDRSANVATTVAGILDGILIEEGQEASARQSGLKKIFDARGKTPAWCFETYKDRLNRRLLLTQDPKDPRNRAIAIAQQCMVAYGIEEPVPTIMAWLEPLSPIMGWNCGGEFSFTEQATRFGHFQTASNYSMNLPILSAATESVQPKKIRQFDPAEIDPDEAPHAVCFVMTDGDNLQWMMGDFCHSAAYWGHPDHGRFPFGWTTCSGHLNQVCPQAVDYLAETQPEGVSLVEYNGGYYYPDLFGHDRPEKNLLARHARRMAGQMQRSGATVLGFICHDVASDGALRAYETFAREIDGLTGMIAVQYAPYEGGHGRVFWAKNRRSEEIPIVTVRYTIWANAPSPGSGTPAKVARMLNETAAHAQQEGRRSRSAVMVHTWSQFRGVRGSDDTTEDVPSGGSGIGGLEPVGWCVERLDRHVKVVSSDELLWRIRLGARSSINRTGEKE